MPRAALDYSKLAAIYDEYCSYAGDLAFLERFAYPVDGRVLELMCGTGRVSLPLLAAGSRTTCVDSSLPMLAVLRRKLRQGRETAPLVCADARRLPFRSTFELALLPFQGLTELSSEAAQGALLASVAEVLASSGRFVCTTHNPVTRLRSADGTWRQVGSFPRPGGGSLSVSLRCHAEPASGNVVGQQRIVVVEPDGETSELVLDLAFRLISLDSLTRLAASAGLRAVETYGDYSGSPYDEASSPTLIVVLERTD